MYEKLNQNANLPPEKNADILAMARDIQGLNRSVIAVRGQFESLSSQVNQLQKIDFQEFKQQSKTAFDRSKLAIEQSKTALATSTSCHTAMESMQRQLSEMQREMESLRALATQPNTDASGQNADSAVNAHLETRVAVLENDSRMSVEHFGQLAAFVNDEVRCWHNAQTVLHDRIDFTRTEISGDCKLEMQQHIELFHSEPYSGSDPGDWQDTAHAPETPLQQAPIALGSLAAERGESFA